MIINTEIEIERGEEMKTVEVSAQVYDWHIEYFYKTDEKLTPDEWDYAEQKIIEQYNG